MTLAGKFIIIGYKQLLLSTALAKDIGAFPETTIPGQVAI